MQWLKNNLKSYLVWSLVGVLVLLSLIPLRLAIANYQAPEPQAILVLGGTTDREFFAAEFARNYPVLDIWASSGSSPKYIQDVFEMAGISGDRLHLDYRATDTVTNFTTLVSDFKQHQIQHIFLITSDFHMPRAVAIATFVLGSQGVTFTPVEVHTDIPRESTFRILRDSGRAILWIVTGQTGASLKTSFMS
jgi:uncharacterized SAM-binding protein YcdF (DUF218 family)